MTVDEGLDSAHVIPTVAWQQQVYNRLKRLNILLIVELFVIFLDSTGTLALNLSPQGSSPEELVQACLGPTATGEVSGAKFHSALRQIYSQNGLVDRDFVNRYKWIKTK